MNELVLYHCPTTRSARVFWLLEEMGLSYRLENHPYEYFSSVEYRKVNPLGQMPALTDGDETIIETTAIMEYLLNRYGPSSLSIKIQHEEYASYLKWLHIAEAGMGGYLSILLGHRFVSERVSDVFEAECEKKITQYIAMLAQQLEGREYVLKRGFSAADISLGYSLYLIHTILKLVLPDIVSKYYQRLQARPAWQRAIVE